MPHVDEGLLHAYLDGALDALLEAGALPHGTTRDSIDAHLAVCADCRALLEAERTVRTRAGAVLDAVAPVVVVPPFSELVAASRARPRRRPRAVPLAWAASVLLAVGAGWWGSALFRSQDRMAALSEPSESAAPAAADAAPPSQRAMSEADARAGADGAAQPIAAPVEPANTAGFADAGLRDADSVAGGAREQLAERTRASDDEVRTRGLAAAGQPGPVPQGQGVAPLAREEAIRRAASADSNRVRGAVLGSVVTTAAAETAAAARADRAAAAPPPSAPTAPPGVQQRAAVGSDFRPAARLDQAVDGSTEPFRQHLADLDAGRVPLSAGAAGNELPLLQLEGGSAPAVQRGALLGASLLRIMQRTADGVDVEVIVWRQAALALDQLVVTGRAETDSAAARAQRQRTEAEVLQKQRVERTPFAHTVVGAGLQSGGRNELLLRSSDGAVFVALRARVPAAELQALAARLVEVRRD